jgi:hypothetical protein
MKRKIKSRNINRKGIKEAILTGRKPKEKEIEKEKQCRDSGCGTRSSAVAYIDSSLRSPHLSHSLESNGKARQTNPAGHTVELLRPVYAQDTEHVHEDRHLRVGPSPAPPSSSSLQLVTVAIASVVACSFCATRSTVAFFGVVIHLFYNTELIVMARGSLLQYYSVVAAMALLR